MDASEVRLLAIRKVEALHGTKLFRENPEQFLAYASQLSIFVLSGHVRASGALSLVNDGNDALKKVERPFPVKGDVVSLAVDLDRGDAFEQRGDKCFTGEAVGHEQAPVSGVATETVAEAGESVSNGILPGAPEAA